MRPPTLLAALIAAVPAISSAQAAAPGFCKAYADTAAWQYRTMRQTAGCARPPSNLWHPDRALHYSWCLTASPWAVNGQRRQRDLALSACDPSYGD